MDNVITEANRLEVTQRGSAKLIEAWQQRSRNVITDEDIAVVADQLEKSPATISHVVLAGGEQATGVGLALNYDGDDGPRCGNDLTWLLELLRKHGGGWVPPIVINNGTPAFDRITVLATLGVLPANAWDAVIPQQIRGVGGVREL